MTGWLDVLLLSFGPWHLNGGSSSARERPRDPGFGICNQPSDKNYVFFDIPDSKQGIQINWSLVTLQANLLLVLDVKI
ncbi:hypothetical protein F5Y12DRAFT_753089 [Xylaria sp. FL1777]|nr:hypothetical protein F5Y12DRAFT_753089 [Xylaria sp. FL1777]